MANKFILYLDECGDQNLASFDPQFPIFTLCGIVVSEEHLYLKPLLIAFFNFSHKRPTFAFTPKTEYTLGSLRKIAHKGLHAETQGFTLVIAWRFISHLTFGQAKAGGGGCTPTACVRFPPAPQPRWAA